MTRFKKLIRSRYAVGLVAALGAGCDGSGVTGDDNGQEGVVRTSGELAAYPLASTDMWTMPLSVCFRKFNGTNFAQYPALKGHAISALQQSWQRATGISFVDAGDCPGTTPSGTLAISVRYGPGFGGSCYVGKGASCDVGGGTDNQEDIDKFKRIIVHEVGHALGFGHEHSRVPENPTTCHGSQASACQVCLTQFNAGQTCSVADYNACVQGLQTPVSQPQFFPPGSQGYGDVNTLYGDIGPHSEFVLLTPYDDLSVLNYCAVDTGARAYTDYVPTAWDVLGAEMFYQANVTYPIACKSGCFLSQGGGAIARTDGSLTTNWTMRGGLNVTITSPVNGSSVPTSSFPNGTSQITFQFNRYSGATRTTGGTLRKSNAYHSALVGTVQGII